jgi:hypothetical protein
LVNIRVVVSRGDRVATNTITLYLFFGVVPMAWPALLVVPTGRISAYGWARAPTWLLLGVGTVFTLFQVEGADSGARCWRDSGACCWRDLGARC